MIHCDRTIFKNVFCQDFQKHGENGHVCGGAMKADCPGRSPSQQQGKGIILEVTVFFSNIFPFFSAYLRI